MKRGTRQSGFTFIEILVTIAIIGILSAMVMNSLQQARDGGKDVAVKENMATVRVEAEIYHDTANTFGTPIAVSATACDAPNTNFFVAQEPVPRAISQTELVMGLGDVLCAIGVDGDTWASSVTITSGTWCVDSSGFAGSGRTAQGGGAATAQCL